MNKIKVLLSILESESPNQELINDVHSISKSILDVKEFLENLISKFKGDEDLKIAIKILHELDVDVEYLINRIEKLG